MRWWIVVCGLALATVAQTSRAEAEGMLVARDPEGHAQGSFPLARTTVEGEVAGDVVSVHVTERFRNTFSQRIEAVYTFPLPDGAAVDAMEMHIGPRVVRAVIERREAARQRYQSARAQGQRAALLEQERPNVFTFSVANVDPGGEIEVDLHYFERARYDHGVYETVFPMTVGPRYIPGAPTAMPAGTGSHADTDRVPDGSRVSPSYTAPGTRSGHAVSLRMRVEAGAPLANIETPAHDTVITRPAPDAFAVTLRDKDEIPNRDFILRWRLDVPDVRAALFAHRPDAAHDGYFALVLSPRNDPPAETLAPREIFFLLDTSGSMSGAPLDTVKAAVLRALDTLNPNDSFQIIDFADTASRMSPTALANTPENLQRARQHLADLRSGGGTNQLAGVHAALTAPGDAERLRYVVFMTDGYIGNEAEVLGLTRRELGDARVFGFGVGSSVNRYLLNEVSLAGRGAAEFLRPHEDARAMVERFYARIGRPYLVDVAIDWGAGGVHDAFPSPVPDLSAFQPLIIYGRYREPGRRTVRVRGRLNRAPFEQTLSIDLPAVEPAHGAISRLWAREKISTLEREMHRNGSSAELVEAITVTALEHHLVSQYTSLVAVDETPAAPGATGEPMQIAQPAEAPEGVDLRTAGGAALGVVQGNVAPATTTGSTAIDESPSPMAPGSREVYATETVSRRGGCAGCTVPRGASRAPYAAVAALALAMFARRRRR
jgi:Ca-activated chloride channel family protein